VTDRGAGVATDRGAGAPAGVPFAASVGEPVLFPSRDRYLDVVTGLRDDGFDLCADLCAVDYLTAPRALPDGVDAGRFEVVVTLVDVSGRRRQRLRVQVPEEDPTLPSLAGFYPAADPMEREAYDLMGVVFTGHPDLTRILLPDTWVGHPLRKDEPMGRIPVQFKGVRRR